MTQRKQTKAVRQSDLQPVYDLIDALQPAHLRAAYNHIDRRTRLMIMISAASIVLLWVSLSMVQFMIHHVQMTTGPFLTDALAAPYSLEARMIPMPPVDQSSILPGSVGEYQLLGNVTQTTAVPSVDTNASTPAVPALQPLVSQTDAQLGKCLYTALNGDAAANCTGYAASFAASADYQNSAGTIINVTMALFASHEQAGQVIRVLQQKAYTLGKTGNFAVGIGPVDYFYSSQSALNSFTWSNGPWVYTIIGATPADLESFATYFPY